MPRTLVVFYSLSGNTEKVARAIAERLDADLEAIRETKARSGGWGYMTAAMSAIFGSMPPIEPCAKDPTDYDMVILGCPVWAQRPATPLHSWAAREKSKLKRIACFCTLGGAGAKNAFSKMADYCGQSAVATLAIDEPTLKSGDWKSKVADFAEAVKKTPA